MSIYKLTKKDIEGLTAVAEGYKVIKYDSSTKGDNNFRYGALNENIIGTIWEVDNDLTGCKWGLHFSKDPANVFNFYKPLGYNRYFRVKAYKQFIDYKETKSVAKCIEFVEEYDLMQYIEIIKRYDRTVSSSIDVSYSNAVSYSTAVSDSTAVSSSNAVNYSNAVGSSNGVCDSNAVRSSNAVSSSTAVNYSNAVSSSNAVRSSIAIGSSTAVRYSNAVRSSIAVCYSNAVSYSNAVRYSIAVSDSIAVNYGKAVSSSTACLKCEAVSKSAFCYKKEGAIYCLFNKKVKKERALEVIEKLGSFGWTPNFANWYDIKGNKEWWALCFPQLENVDNKTAWSKMPKEMLEYIRGLPEFNQNIFDKITGDIDND